MAKYTINHTCGHTSEVNLYGSSKERSSKIAWLEGQECPECRKAREQAQAAATTEAMGLPTLQGSDKQIAWAMSIRDKMLVRTVAGATVAQLVERYNAMTAEQQSQVEAAVKADSSNPFALVYNVATQTSAAWFIDNRF